ncbi:hypothetical protein Tco_1105573 [Tanacetum coccineum]
MVGVTATEEGFGLGLQEKGAFGLLFHQLGGALVGAAAAMGAVGLWVSNKRCGWLAATTAGVIVGCGQPVVGFGSDSRGKGELTFCFGFIDPTEKERLVIIKINMSMDFEKDNLHRCDLPSTPTRFGKAFIQPYNPCMQFVHVARVSPKTSHLLAVKRIFRYLKGKPSLGLWYSKDSPLELVAYTDSDYAGATQDRKSTTGGCQFLGNRLISWQCKKQTVVATSTTEAEYVAAASCCGQVLWIQNQLLDYGYNFMNTVIYIDNNSTICIIENPVQHSKTKHIEIRHHFIRDCNAKKLIQMAKIDTEHNVADLLTKGFDAGRFQYLVSSIGMLNP